MAKVQRRRRSGPAPAWRRGQEAGVEVAWVEGDATNLPLATRSLDFVYDRGCLYHLKGAGPWEYADELARVLRPGGRYQPLAFTSRFQRS